MMTPVKKASLGCIAVAWLALGPSVDARHLRTKESTSITQQQRLLDPSDFPWLPNCVVKINDPMPRADSMDASQSATIQYFFALESSIPVLPSVIEELELYLYYILHAAIEWCPSTTDSDNVDDGNHARRWLAERQDTLPPFHAQQRQLSEEERRRLTIYEVFAEPGDVPTKIACDDVLEPPAKDKHCEVYMGQIKVVAQNVQNFTDKITESLNFIMEESKILVPTSVHHISRQRWIGTADEVAKELGVEISDIIVVPIDVVGGDNSDSSGSGGDSILTGGNDGIIGGDNSDTNGTGGDGILTGGNDGTIGGDNSDTNGTDGEDILTPGQDATVGVELGGNPTNDELTNLGNTGDEIPATDRSFSARNSSSTRVYVSSLVPIALLIGLFSYFLLLGYKRRKSATTAGAAYVVEEFQMVGTGDPPRSFHEGNYHCTVTGSRYLSTRCDQCRETRLHGFFTANTLSTIHEVSTSQERASSSRASPHTVSSANSSPNLRLPSPSLSGDTNATPDKSGLFIPGQKMHYYNLLSDSNLENHQRDIGEELSYTAPKSSSSDQIARRLAPYHSNNPNTDSTDKQTGNPTFFVARPDDPALVASREEPAFLGKPSFESENTSSTNNDLLFDTGNTAADLNTMISI